ncbi:hypothetical protein MCEMSEM18_03657 [Comamonadaceae bacterium]
MKDNPISKAYMPTTFTTQRWIYAAIALITGSIGLAASWITAE